MTFADSGKVAFLLYLASVIFVIAEEKSELRINEIQLIGTHNSYHIALPEKNLSKIGFINRRLRESLEYTHRPLKEQLQFLGVRHFELDIYADPKGGHYSRHNKVNLLGLNAPMMFKEEMKKPGFKVLHDSAVDYLTTTPTLIHALNEIKIWSQKKS